MVLVRRKQKVRVQGTEEILCDVRRVCFLRDHDPLCYAVEAEQYSHVIIWNEL